MLGEELIAQVGILGGGVLIKWQPGGVLINQIKRCGIFDWFYNRFILQ